MKGSCNTGNGENSYSTINVIHFSDMIISIEPYTKSQIITENQTFFYVKEMGQYTITATQGTNIKSQIVNISSYKQYSVISFKDVPMEYQQVEYLESTGTQYILFSTTKGNINTRLQLTSLTSQMNGGGNGGTNHNARLAVGSESNGKWAFLCGTQSETTSDVSADTLVHDLKIIFEGSNGTLYLDDIELYTKAAPYSGTTTYFAIFGYSGYNQTKPNFLCSERIMHFEIEGQHDLYPCYRKSDHVAGMWDKTTQTFYTNNGIGTFIVGANL